MKPLTYDIAEAPKYSDPKPGGGKLITPLGAAIVEAMPDRALMRYIKKRFKEHGQVPVSSLFTADQIAEFYESHDMKISSAPRGVRPSKQKCPCLTQGSPQCGTTCWHYGMGDICVNCENTGTAATIRRDDTADTQTGTETQ